MTEDKVQLFMVSNSKFFPTEKIAIVKERLEGLDDSKLTSVSSIDYKDPSTLLLISIFVGGFGVDRFMLGETGMGLLKLFTGGLCGILTIYDWFTISKRTKEQNFAKFLELA